MQSSQQAPGHVHGGLPNLSRAAQPVVVEGPLTEAACVDILAVMPDGHTRVVNKPNKLIDAFKWDSVPSSAGSTLLVVNMAVDPSILPASHPDFGIEGLAPRLNVMYLDYMSTERLQSICEAKHRSMTSSRPVQARRLCFKCLDYDTASDNPNVRGTDLTKWNRQNPMRNIMGWHPLRMFMSAVIPTEVTWHRACFDEEGKTLSKVRDAWLGDTPGALWKELTREEGEWLAGDVAVTKVSLFGILPPRSTTNNDGSRFNYDGFITKMWDTGVPMNIIGLASWKDRVVNEAAARAMNQAQMTADLAAMAFNESADQAEGAHAATPYNPLFFDEGESRLPHDPDLEI